MSRFFYRLIVIAEQRRNRLKVIPVMDVLDGIVVHAVRGKRSEYHPLKSTLCESTDPVGVGTALKKAGFSELYVADLDAIESGHPNFALFKRMADETGLELMVDAGITDLIKAQKMLQSRVSKIIIGTETLTNLKFVAEAIKSFGSEKVIVSLDLRGKQIISRFQLCKLTEPMRFLRKLKGTGLSQIIVLDLEKVGSGKGVNLPFLRAVLKNTKSNVFIGGGVRGFVDLMTLKDLGVYGVLVATALHSGKISLEELKQAMLL